MGFDHAVARSAGNARRAPDQGDAMGATFGLGEVRPDQVGAPDTFGLGVTAASQGSHQPDAIGHHQGGGLEHRAERRAPPRHHHHLGIERDHDRRMRRCICAAPFHHLHEGLHGGGHVDDVDGASEHTSPHRRPRGGRRLHPTAWCTAAPSVLA